MVASSVGSRLLLLLLLLLAGRLIVLIVIEQEGREGGCLWGEEDQRRVEEWQKNRRKEEKEVMEKKVMEKKVVEKEVMEKEGRDIVEEQEGIEWGEKFYFNLRSSKNELKEEHKDKQLKSEETQKGNAGLMVLEQPDPYSSLMDNSSTRDLVFLLAEVAALPPPSPPSPSCRPPPLPHRPTCDQTGTQTHNMTMF